MKRDLPAKPEKRSISAEELAEAMRRLEPKHLAEQEAVSRPGDEVVRELQQKHAGPR